MPSKLATDLKTHQIKNPKTGKMIKLTSALSYGTSYGKDDIAYKAAVAYIKKHKNRAKTGTIGTSSKQPTALKGKSPAQLSALSKQVDEAIAKLTDSPPVDLSECRTYKGHKHMDDHFSSAYGEAYDALRAKHTENRKSFKNYTLSHYGRINKCLRRIDTCSTESKKDIESIQRIIHDAPPLEEPIIVHRGISDKYLAKAIQDNIGGTISDNGFVSTSGDVKSARQFIDFIDGVGAQLDITLPTGTKGISVNQYLRTGSRNADEAEFLLPKGAQFKVIGVTSVNNTVPTFHLEYIVGSGLDQ